MGGWARMPVGQIEFIVTHPDIPPKVYLQGEKIQVVVPTFRKQEPIVFEGWNPK